MSNLYSSKPQRKPLKGGTVTSNYGVFDTVSTNTLVLESINVAGLFEDGILLNAIIQDSEIRNTVIGLDGPNTAYFTNLYTYANVQFYGNIIDANVQWDPNEGVFTVNGEFVVRDCSRLGNIKICDNDVYAVNSNGDVNILSNNFGTVNIRGPVSIISTTGNYSTQVLNGSASFVIKDNFTVYSSKGTLNLTAFDTSTINALNGDLNINVDTGISSRNLNLVQNTSGNTVVTSGVPHLLKAGDVVTLSNTNSVPTLNGSFTVGNVLSDTTFTLIPNTTLTSNSTRGNFIKTPSNNINLNTHSLVKIPTDTKLTFGTTCNNISGNASRLLISSCGDTVFGTTTQVNVPQNTKFSFGTSGNNYITYDGVSLNIVADTITNDSTRILFKDPILTLANYTTTTNDNKDRGVEFKYFDNDTNSMQTGWFGYKNSTGRFTFITNATNNNEVITGNIGSLELNNLVLDNIQLVQNGTINVNCGQILNVNTITGCGNNLTINAPTTTINASNTINLTATTEVNIPPSTLLRLGTTFLQNSSSTLIVSSPSNVFFSAASLNIPTATPLTFDGSTTGSSRISANSAGELLLSSFNNIRLSTTSASILLPPSTPIAFGNTTQAISGTTSGINIVSSSSNSNVNVVSPANVNISSSNINLTASNNISVPTEIPITFGQTNLVKTTSNGNFLLSTVSSGSASLAFSNINLNASNNVNVPVNTSLNVGSNGSLLSNSTDLRIWNNSSSGTLQLFGPNVTITTGTLLINATTGNIQNTVTNLSSGTFTVSGSSTNIKSTNTSFDDPIITVGDAIPDNKDRGVEWRYLGVSTGAPKLGWIGAKSSGVTSGAPRLTYYSDAINTNEVITGTVGDMQISSMYIDKDIAFSSAGSLNMACGTITNTRRINGCSGQLQVNGSNNIDLIASDINISAGSKVTIPFNVPLNFGTSSNSFVCDSTGSLVINSASQIVLNSNVRINGTSTTIYSTITNIQDPIFSLGGVVGPLLNDAKDRGIEFKWNSSTGTAGSKVGFFGYKNNLGKFVFIKDGTNVDEVFSGAYGDVQFGNGAFTNIDLGSGGGVISSVKTISGGEITVSTTSGNISLTPTRGSTVLLPYDTKLSFGSTSNSISSDTAGNMTLLASNNTTVTSQSGGILLNASNSVQIPSNVPLLFGTSGSSIVSSGTTGNLTITSPGNLNLSPSGGNVNVPTNTFLNFGSTSNSIYSNGQQLLLNGYEGISMTAPTLSITGNLDVLGSLSVGASDLDTNKYILPLGTNQVLNVTSASTVVSTSGNIQIITDAVHNFSIGDPITLKNVNSSPSIDGDYLVTRIVNATTFYISSGTLLTTNGLKGLVKSNLTTFQGKDVGIQVNYWSTTNAPSVTAGSLAYKTGFFGWKNDVERWQFYQNATINNNVVTGNLGAVQADKLFTNRLSGFSLDGPVSAGSNAISGNNFQISGGSIQSTPIGNSIASTGRFTTLSNTVQAVFQNVTLQSSLAYSFERYTLDSATLQTRNPSANVVLSMFSVNGPNWTSSSGTMPSTSVADGTFKILVCSAVGTGSSHTIHFGTGKLITPNPLNTSAQPSKLVFKRQSQSAQLVFDAVQSAWILIGSGAYVQ